MKTIYIETNKRTNHLINGKNKKRINKKIGDVLKILGINQIGNGKNNYSTNHDNILYK